MYGTFRIIMFRSKDFEKQAAAETATKKKVFWTFGVLVLSLHQLSCSCTHVKVLGSKQTHFFLFFQGKKAIYTIWSFRLMGLVRLFANNTKNQKGMQC
jgi:uncharacterized protein YhhL (DUF1145 family)